jgi:dCTP deaminase
VLTDDEIRTSIAAGDLVIDPFADSGLQPASYDLRVGNEAFVSGATTKLDVASAGLVIVEPGEFAVLATMERVHCGPQVAGQLGLESTYAKQGLTLLSGPQVDPGFNGVLIVRVTNLAPRRITLAHGAPFLTVQFFKLAQPAAKPYSGSRQGQTGLSPRDIEELSSTDSPTMGGMVKALSALAGDVGELTGNVREVQSTVKVLTWALGLGVAFLSLLIGIAAILAA